MFSLISDLIIGKPAVRRHKLWAQSRKAHLKEQPVCVVCGGNKKLQVHHIIPVHIDPDRELDTTNLITLCRKKKYGIDCHLAVGHLGDWKKYNKSLDTTIGFIKHIKKGD